MKNISLFKKNSVAIIGGGPSLKGFDFNLLKKINTIAVNVAIFYVPWSTHFITRDYTFMVRFGHGYSLTYNHNARFKSYPCQKYFVAAFDGTRLVEEDGVIRDPRCRLKYNLSVFNNVIRSYRSDGIGKTFEDFRAGGDSGYCALQLAIIQGYKNIYLFGIDLTVTETDKHYHNHYFTPDSFKKKLNGWFENKYVKAIDDIKAMGVNLYSCSSISRLNDLIPYVGREEAFSWKK